MRGIIFVRVREHQSRSQEIHLPTQSLLLKAKTLTMTRSRNKSDCLTPKKGQKSPLKASSISSPSRKHQFSFAKPTQCLELTNPLEELQRVLRLRITQSQSPPTVNGYREEREQLYELLKRTALTGESNSLLLIGPRGCGKSMLLNNVIGSLLEITNINDNLLTVWLNGLLQTDDKIALNEITRQLNLENTVGDKVFGSFAETLQFLLQALKKGGQESKPILFVLEEFDLFAQHKNQTLLYNLFDISQSAQTPICVVGTTCRLDVMELLEKRVKSRFSHRQLHLFNKWTLDRFTQMFSSLLTLGEDFPHQSFKTQWNNKIMNLTEEASVKDIIERQFSLSNDVRGLINLLTLPICQISKTHPEITPSDIVSSFKMMSTDSKSSILHGVSILELCLIIAMKHLIEIYDGEPFNFEMVYSEYIKFAKKRMSMQVYEKPVVMKAYEHLQTLELIGQLGHTHINTQKEYSLMTLLVHSSQVMDALQKYPGCPTEIRQWASQPIG